jgi:hypothetical protein
MTTAKEPTPLDFVIVGAQRSASTSLSTCLRRHPELFIYPDEVPYFEDPFFSSTAPSEFAKVFAAAHPGQRRGIQRPDYLGRPECAINIKTYAPDARILAVLRRPSARAVSAYFWYVQFGLLPLLPLDEGMERLLDGWTDTAYPRAREIIEYGFYGRHLSRYVETFGRDRVLALVDEDMHGLTALRRVYEFLGVSTAMGATRPEGVRNAGVYDLRRLRCLRARRRFVWSWDDVSVFECQRRRRRRPLRFLPNAAIVGFDRLVLARIFRDAQRSLRPDVATRLAAVYAPDVARLEALLQRDLATWRTPDGSSSLAECEA